MAELSDAAHSAFLAFRCFSTGKLGVEWDSGQLENEPQARYSRHRLALRHSGTAVTGYIDGRYQGTKNATMATAGMTQLFLGSSQGGKQLSGYVKKVKYWPAAIPDADLKALTAP